MGLACRRRHRYLYLSLQPFGPLYIAAILRAYNERSCLSIGAIGKRHITKFIFVTTIATDWDIFACSAASRNNYHVRSGETQSREGYIAAESKEDKFRDKNKDGNSCVSSHPIKTG